MKRFRFELEPILTKQSWEVDQLRTEKITASRAVAAQQNELRAIENTIASCRASLVGASAVDADISLSQQQLVKTYIRHQQHLESETRQSFNKALAIEQQLAEQLLLASQQLKALEKLKGRAKQQHAYAEKRAEHSEADENWLTHTFVPNRT